MSGIPALVFTVLAALSAGCASPPPPPLPPQPQPTTALTLLPDADGRVGVVMITAGGAVQRLDQAYSRSVVAGHGIAPTAAETGSAEAVHAAHADLLRAEPSAPRSFTLYFLLDRTVLTEASRLQLAAVLRIARERKPTEITVFGHADGSGTDARNLKLSADRARLVADLLRADDPDVGPVDVQYFGDKAPLVPAAPGAVEPRNRRAEIQIL